MTNYTKIAFFIVIISLVYSTAQTSAHSDGKISLKISKCKNSAAGLLNNNKGALIICNPHGLITKVDEENLAYLGTYMSHESRQCHVYIKPVDANITYQFKKLHLFKDPEKNTGVLSDGTCVTIDCTDEPNPKELLGNSNYRGTYTTKDQDYCHVSAVSEH